MPETDAAQPEKLEDPEREEFAILLFDGVCNLCNGWVDFVIRRDPRGRIRFAALQSAAGSKALRDIGLPNDYLDSIIFIDVDGTVRTASTGVLATLRELRWPWPLFYALILIPAPVRDFFYRHIAEKRYLWFGKRDTCRLPTEDEERRFL